MVYNPSVETVGESLSQNTVCILRQCSTQILFPGHHTLAGGFGIGNLEVVTLLASHCMPLTLPVSQSIQLNSKINVLTVRTISHSEVIHAKLITGNLTLNQTATLKQCWAAWGERSLLAIDREPMITSPVIPNNR